MILPEGVVRSITELVKCNNIINRVPKRQAVLMPHKASDLSATDPSEIDFEFYYVCILIKTVIFYQLMILYNNIQ